MKRVPNGIRVVAMSLAILAILLSSAQRANAGGRVPIWIEPDPIGGPGGGGGVTCVTQHCAYCSEDCNMGGCWDVCRYGAFSAACACGFESGVCYGNGSCTYVP